MVSGIAQPQAETLGAGACQQGTPGAGVEQHDRRCAVDAAGCRDFQAGAGVVERQLGDLDVFAGRRRRRGGSGERQGQAHRQCGKE